MFTAITIARRVAGQRHAIVHPEISPADLSLLCLVLALCGAWDLVEGDVWDVEMSAQRTFGDGWCLFDRCDKFVGCRSGV
jgi:hypothetical protein